MLRQAKDADMSNDTIHLLIFYEMEKNSIQFMVTSTVAGKNAED